MLDYSGFKSEFISRCRQKLDERAFAFADKEVYIEEQPVRKAQSGELTGLIFRTRGSTCSPTLYVEDYFRMYESGHSVDDLSLAALTNVIPYIDNAPCFPEDAFEDTSNLRIRLLNSSRNSEYLKEVPHVDCGCGLALIAEVRHGEYRASVTNGLLASMEICRDELFEIALENSTVEDPPVLYELSELLMKGHDCCSNLLDEENGSFIPSGSLYLLSNRNCFWGSAVLFYPGVAEKICELMNGAFYVLPSSVHEVLILPLSEGDPQKLADIICTANRTVVDDSDFLSDDLYLCKDGVVSRACCNVAASIPVALS